MLNQYTSGTQAQTNQTSTSPMWPNVLHNRKMAPLSHLKTLSDKCAWVRKHTHFIISKKKKKKCLRNTFVYAADTIRLHLRRHGNCPAFYVPPRIYLNLTCHAPNAAAVKL